MEVYNKEDIELLQKENGENDIYVPKALFDSMQYKLVRLEVKWAYVAFVNVLIKTPNFDKENLAYLKDDQPMVVEALKKIANKEVDLDKIRGYLKELEELELCEIKNRNVYLKKIISVVF